MSQWKCPYCGGDLEKGTLRSRGGNYFLPDGEKVPAWFGEKSMARKGAILLPPDPLAARPQWPEAFACRACKKIILSYE